MLFHAFALPLLLPLSGALASSGDGEPAPAMAAKRVAIIGGGAAGSSAAYHLAQSAQAVDVAARIQVFERSSRIGGRATTVHAWSDFNQPVELGASIFVEVNRILVAATEAFNLSTASPDPVDTQDTPELGVWNGDEFVFISTARGGWWDMAKLIWRYGYAPIKTNGLMKSTVARFLKMYEEPLFPWKSLSDVVQEVGLTEETAVTGAEFLEKKGVSEKFANELVQASTRVNYASNLGRIHGVETMVCMAANGAMAIAGGNWQIFDRMVRSSKAISTHLNTTVARISKQPDGTYTLTTSDGKQSTFDDVVLAAPLQFSGLVIDPPPKHTPDQIPYVKLYVTLFATPYKLDPLAFNLGAGEDVPQYVLTTLPPGAQHDDSDPAGKPGFFSISIVKSGINTITPMPRKEHIYKIFSPRPVDAAFLSRVLGREVTDVEAEEGDPNGTVSWIYHKIWHSYPEERPRVTFEEIALDEGLWYTAGIESFISTMETSALMGKNVAGLIVDGWKRKREGEELKVQGEGVWEYAGVKHGEEQKPLRAKL